MSAAFLTIVVAATFSSAPAAGRSSVTTTNNNLPAHCQPQAITLAGPAVAVLPAAITAPLEPILWLFLYAVAAAPQLQPLRLQFPCLAGTSV